jgi:phosphoribosylglycinamide formyltransferase 1
MAGRDRLLNKFATRIPSFMHQIAIFASGNGSNAQRIIEHFEGSPSTKVALVLCNNPSAYVLERARLANIPTLLFNRQEFYESDRVPAALRNGGITLIVLAGFLWLIPSNILAAYPGRIINIHPALLPRYGGKGMYGMKVHEAVLASGDPESGISIHFVNDRYDDGNIIFQARCPVLPGDTPDTLATRIHQLEHLHYPQVIDQLLLSLNS